MKYGLLDGGVDGEYIGFGHIDISKRLLQQDGCFLGAISVDKVYHPQISSPNVSFYTQCAKQNVQVGGDSGQRGWPRSHCSYDNC